MGEGTGREALSMPALLWGRTSQRQATSGKGTCGAPQTAGRGVGEDRGAGKEARVSYFMC